MRPQQIGFPPEGGEKGNGFFNPLALRPQPAINRHFISTVSTALPLSTLHFLANTAIETCPVEGDSTSDEKLGVMADATFQEGFKLNQWVVVF